MLLQIRVWRRRKCKQLVAVVCYTVYGGGLSSGASPRRNNNCSVAFYIFLCYKAKRLYAVLEYGKLPRCFEFLTCRFPLFTTATSSNHFHSTGKSCNKSSTNFSIATYTVRRCHDRENRSKFTPVLACYMLCFCIAKVYYN